jgi:hypothetical protein
MLEVGFLYDNAAERRSLTTIHHFPFFGEERNRFANGPNCPGDQVRQVLATALHPEPVQVDLHQLSAELPFYRRKDLYVRDAKSRLIRIWVRETERFAAMHFNSPEYLQQSCTSPDEQVTAAERKSWPQSVSVAIRNGSTMQKSALKG